MPPFKPLPHDPELKRLLDALKHTKWDLRYLKLAQLVSTWSKDPSTKCGAVIVRPDKSVCSVGYNGFPRSMSDAEHLYANREMKLSRMVHCEINALLHANEPVKGFTLYTYPLACCDRCAVQMIQAGIGTFINPTIPADKVERWGKIVERSVEYFAEAKVKHVEIEI